LWCLPTVPVLPVRMVKQRLATVKK
jgi:hypothetical protein